VQSAGRAWGKSYSYFTHPAKIIDWLNPIPDSKRTNNIDFYSGIKFL